MASSCKCYAPLSLNTYFLCIIRFALDTLYFYTQIKASLENIRQGVDFEWDHYFQNIGSNYNLVEIGCRILKQLYKRYDLKINLKQKVKYCAHLTRGTKREWVQPLLFLGTAPDPLEIWIQYSYWEPLSLMHLSGRELCPCICLCWSRVNPSSFISIKICKLFGNSTRDVFSCKSVNNNYVIEII